MSSPPGGTRILRVDALARVEGEGAMIVTLRNGRVEQVQLRIYEPPRFFEALLRGRSFTEPPDITARICGICPVAYQMSACQAIEDACGVTVDGPIADLRRLLYCGEWIESHALHIYLLHAPDFLGYAGAVEMADRHRDLVERGLQLKKAGNQIISVLGGRAIHPINVRVGGFWRVPAPTDLAPLGESLQRARELALQTVAWVGGFDFPDFEGNYEFVSLRHPAEYPILRGRIVSSEGIDVEPGGWDDCFVEDQVAHSTALHAGVRGRGTYLTGPLARYNLNAGLLSPLAVEAAAAAGLRGVCRNPFQSIVVRAVEVLYACDEALRIIDGYEQPDAPAVAVEPVAATGHGCTEAPRGLLYHRYRLGAGGRIEDARIVPPTSQNLAQIEQDLSRFVQDRLSMPTTKLRARCEQAIRNHDPCISCATHFLDLRLQEA